MCRWPRVVVVVVVAVAAVVVLLLCCAVLHCAAQGGSYCLRERAGGQLNDELHALDGTWKISNI